MKLKDSFLFCRIVDERKKGESTLLIIEDYSSVVKELLSLAKRRRLTYQYNLTKQSEEHVQVARDLEEYLNRLSLEEIQFIQVVMYLGRDTTDYDRAAHSGKELFNSLYRELSEGNFNNKLLGAEQISGKMPLDEYLVKGLKIIGGIVV